MNEKKQRIIFHVDVNSAYLSWTAVKILQYGGKTDIRKIPSAIGGDEEERHGIILASSIPAKELGIKTGESLYVARQKCPDIKIFPPDYSCYMKSSAALVNLLKEYSPAVQRYSIDECFMDCSHFKDNYMEKAIEIKSRITEELGFNCNIGISENKLLAKMASDFKPKNSIHTLFKKEIEKKMWPLPISDLFMVGRASSKKLADLNINTIGELAKVDVNILISKMHSHGKLIHDYANGIENSPVRKNNYLDVKGIGNSVTISYDIERREEAHAILLSLTESVAMRLRENKSMCRVVCISVKSDEFVYYSHQKILENYTDSTNTIYSAIKKIFNERWRGEKIRQLGVSLSRLKSNDQCQMNMFDFKYSEKQRKIDKAVDTIREKYGKESIVRSTFINSGFKAVEGGTDSRSDYPMMGSIL